MASKKQAAARRPQADEDDRTAARVADGSNAGFLVRQLHRAFARVLAERLAEHKVSPAQWTVLRALWRQDDCSQVDLANAICVEKASLTQVLLTMERAGLITRERSLDDRRRWLVRLTPQGRKLEALLLPIAVRIEEEALTGFSPDDAGKFRAWLARAFDNLQ